MEKLLFELLFKYAMAKKTVDQKFIEDLKKIVISSRQLDKYITKIYLKDEHNREIYLQGEYFNKEIIIYINYLTLQLKSYKNGLFYDFEYYFYRNAKIIWIILHEIEHGNHLKLYNENPNELITKIIKPCIEISKGILPLKENTSKLCSFLDKYSAIFIDERIANIYATKEILKIIENEQDLFPNLYPYVKNYYFYLLLHGYTETTNPLKQFFNTIKYPDLYDNLINYEKEYPIMDLLTKMTYGFPTTSTEYKRIQKKQNHSCCLKQYNLNINDF